MAAVSFDRANRELRTVRFHFKDKNDAVISILWEEGVARNSIVAGEQVVARIKWRDSKEEVIRTPKACAGRVERTNRRIPYADLPHRSVPLLSLAR